jgi:peroxiredoxin
MKHLTVILTLLSVTLLQAQKISLDFPHFASQAYSFSIPQGSKSDTILRGTLDKNGRTTLSIPAKYADYQGVGVWRLASGGGLDFILNGEKSFALGCPDPQPSVEKIVYSGSAENQFDVDAYLLQQQILAKYETISQAAEIYKNDSLSAVFEQEKRHLQQAYNDLQTQIKTSPLYAGRYRQLNNLLQNLPDSLTQQEIEEQYNQRVRKFIAEQLDLNFLYHTNQWNNVFDCFMYLHTGGESDSVLVANSRSLLTRTDNAEISEALLQKLILQFNRYGKENLLVELGIEDLLTVGRPAPKLHLSRSNIQPQNALLIFYESGCNNCENELGQLIGNYPDLKAKGIRVISISADTDKETYETNAARFPWSEADKYCDFKGFSGDNFRNYYVVGTPTIFGIDKDGKITGRHARVAEYLDLIEN